MENKEKQRKQFLSGNDDDQQEFIFVMGFDLVISLVKHESFVKSSSSYR